MANKESNKADVLLMQKHSLIHSFILLHFNPNCAVAAALLCLLSEVPIRKDRGGSLVELRLVPLLGMSVYRAEQPQTHRCFCLAWPSLLLSVLYNFKNMD